LDVRKLTVSSQFGLASVKDENRASFCDKGSVIKIWTKYFVNQSNHGEVVGKGRQTHAEEGDKGSYCTISKSFSRPSTGRAK